MSAGPAAGGPAHRRGRGRPVGGIAFDTAARVAYLEAVTAGAKLTEAAAKVGVSRNVPAQHAKTDPEFRAALDEAKARGKAARIEQMAHGEYRYNHGGCRCRICRTEASKARAGRPDRVNRPTRNTRHKETPKKAQPIPITGRTPSSSTPFSLARAS
ncbi:hypothetical protein ACFV2X_38125 [Streptomyces sp. NPDC059679]|uniref:hypothetical protein n=1 Tax=Streptomyces sp. NPDC059679 TaxID=3346903 RepID=UPI0036BB3066